MASMLGGRGWEQAARLKMEYSGGNQCLKKINFPALSVAYKTSLSFLGLENF
jgi:hypothetical protein